MCREACCHYPECIYSSSQRLYPIVKTFQASVIVNANCTDCSGGSVVEHSHCEQEVLGSFLISHNNDIMNMVPDASSLSVSG